MSPVYRFAPSPNGLLHLGHALSALTGFELARRTGGRFLLRIEDIDTARARPEFVAAIFDDLRWLGLDWEQPVLVQSEHFADYRAVAARLQSDGLLYPCFATRSEIAAAAERNPAGLDPVPLDAARLDPEGAPLYPGRHNSLTSAEVMQRRARGEPVALRIDMARAIERAEVRLGARALTFTELLADGTRAVVAADPARWGDAVIMRKDVPASYHLAVVVDDARQGVSHVTRGYDLFAATGLHRLLQVLLGLPEPIYHHHRLIADPVGRKLSKSAGDTSLRSLRQAGLTAEAVRGLLSPIIDPRIAAALMARPLPP
ncbi:MAG: tRNA glutamyl-Q(34) synthetase GluQRS [Hyphomicrobium sp.]